MPASTQHQRRRTCHTLLPPPRVSPVLTIPTSPPGQTGSTSYASRARERGSPSPPFFIPCGSWGLGLPPSFRPNPRAKYTRNSSPRPCSPHLQLAEHCGRFCSCLLCFSLGPLCWIAARGTGTFGAKPCPGPSSRLALGPLCPTLLPPLPQFPGRGLETVVVAGMGRGAVDPDTGMGETEKGVGLKGWAEWVGTCVLAGGSAGIHSPLLPLHSCL